MKSEAEPDKCVYNGTAHAKEEKVLELDRHQGERELDLVELGVYGYDLECT